MRNPAWDMTGRKTITLFNNPTVDVGYVAPYITATVFCGNEIITSPATVYGIKRKAGYAAFTAGDKTGTVRATATAAITAGAVSSVTQGTLGKGYTSAPTVTVGAPGGGGTQAVITATVAPAFVEYCYLTAVGSGYLQPPTVSFSAPPSGTTATGTARVRDGKVVGITITDPGKGYAVAPTITLTPVNGGSGAAATAVLAQGSITLAVTTPGSGYASAPSVSIAAPTALPNTTAYPEGLGLATVLTDALYGPTLPAPGIGSQILVVHDDRSAIAYGLMGDGPAVPLSRAPDSFRTWYQTLVAVTGAHADADGAVPAWVAMEGGL